MDLETRKIAPTAKLQEAIDRLNFILSAKGSSVFRPNKEKDELAYTIGTAEHGGRTRGKGAVPWKYGFPEDIGTYKCRQRKKEELEERMRKMEDLVLKSNEALAQSQEREKAMEARMQEEI